MARKHLDHIKDKWENLLERLLQRNIIDEEKQRLQSMSTTELEEELEKINFLRRQSGEREL